MSYAAVADLVARFGECGSSTCLGAFFAGGGISFRKQKLPLVAQVIMWLIALALFGYGAYVAFTFGS